MRWAIWFALVICCLLILFSGTAFAQSTEDALYHVLKDQGSPLAEVVYTPVAFWRQHPDFPIDGWLTVVGAETSLARDSFARRTWNIGCIRGGKAGTPWRDLRTGTYKGFNTYASLYDGQQASIRLIWDKGYWELLARKDWRGFTKRYWGGDYNTHAAHREEYIRDLQAIHAMLVRRMAAEGVKW